MFNGLLDLEKQRTALEAFGFYVAYFVLGILSSSLLGYVFTGGAIGDPTYVEGDLIGYQIGQSLSVVFSLVLTAAVAYKKSSGFLGMVLTLVAGISAIFIGLLLGFIPAAFLTTRPSARRRQPGI